MVASVEILTIGHSNRSWDEFVALLQRYQVTTLADVRSSPHSRLHPHFSRRALATALQSFGIRYIYLGRELGGRPDDPSCYEDGQVVYERVVQTRAFRAGLRRLQLEAALNRVAIMCAEEDPLACHRALVIGQELSRSGASVYHIRGEGRLESHGQAMRELLRRHGMQTAGLFESEEQLIAEACRRQAKTVAYKVRIDPPTRSRKSHR